MDRLQRLFNSKNKEILSIYFTAGFPKLNDMCEIIETLDAAGVDLIEIGIPFSDPMADGLTIQESNAIALKNGMSIPVLFSQLINIRQSTQIPLLLMGYLNPILSYGFENFCIDAKKCGIDAFIIPDIPISEYLSTYRELLNKYELKLIFLITPQTSPERIVLIDSISNGFIYLVTSSSVTGKTNGFSQENLAYLQRVSNMNLTNPLLAGFGISTQEDFDAICRYTNGGIIGSKFIEMLRDNTAEMKYSIPEFVKKFYKEKG